jgi:hypothetical protein
MIYDYPRVSTAAQDLVPHLVPHLVQLTAAVFEKAHREKFIPYSH